MRKEPWLVKQTKELLFYEFLLLFVGGKDFFIEQEFCEFIVVK